MQMGHPGAAFRLLWSGADPSQVPQEAAPPDALELVAAWRRGELRHWTRRLHPLLPAAFRADVAALLLATIGTPDAGKGANPLRRLLLDCSMLDGILQALMLAHMGPPAALPLPAAPAA